ncbi:MAG: twin-arginine translocase TatA/TatE family subunit [Syntrophobacteraceae bacterium]|nr:twin-arginine translocase TatA/TatE family subunit [Syntrophobacteraceae bacterium]
MMGLGVGELILILILVLFFCGGKRLPLIGEGLGRGITEFKRALRNLSPSEKDRDKKH